MATQFLWKFGYNSVIMESSKTMSKLNKTKTKIELQN